MMRNIFCEEKIIGFEEYLIISQKEREFRVRIKATSRQIDKYKITIKAKSSSYIDGFDMQIEKQPMK